jgi:hypothetical protein
LCGNEEAFTFHIDDGRKSLDMTFQYNTQSAKVNRLAQDVFASDVLPLINQWSSASLSAERVNTIVTASYYTQGGLGTDQLVLQCTYIHDPTLGVVPKESDPDMEMNFSVTEYVSSNQDWFVSKLQNVSVNISEANLSSKYVRFSLSYHIISYGFSGSQNPTNPVTSSYNLTIVCDLPYINPAGVSSRITGTNSYPIAVNTTIMDAITNSMSAMINQLSPSTPTTTSINQNLITWGVDTTQTAILSSFNTLQLISPQDLKFTTDLSSLWFQTIPLSNLTTDSTWSVETTV